MIVPETKGFIDEDEKTGDCDYSMTFSSKMEPKDEIANEIYRLKIQVERIADALTVALYLTFFVLAMLLLIAANQLI